MAHTFHKLYYHLVWSTKERQPLLVPEIQTRLFEYLGGSFRNLECNPITIGGMPDHVHALISVPPKIAISEVMRNVKTHTSKWVKETFNQAGDFAWQEGFGAFSVSQSGRDEVIKYIRHQKEHHQSYTFKEEFIKFLKLYEVEFNEEYLWR